MCGQELNGCRPTKTAACTDTTCGSSPAISPYLLVTRQTTASVFTYVRCNGFVADLAKNAQRRYTITTAILSALERRVRT